MSSSGDSTHNKIIVDAIHGDIRLNKMERRIVDTAPFQRLRRIKQLGMAHLTYPNATHSRFAHSLGVFHIMCRLLSIAEENGLKFSKEDVENLRLAALMHDIGHYPYSHLLEKMDSVELTEAICEEDTASNKTLEVGSEKFPSHEEFGRWIATKHSDIRDVLGSDRARTVSDLFTRSQAVDPQKSKLIHSSADMDRLDYLVRDSRATGAPYGEIDLNYLLNSLRVSSEGIVGFSEKALPAVEHMLLARFFMHRTVYYHKTTYGFEQACLQLLRRLWERKDDGLPKNAEEIRNYPRNPEKFNGFTDSLIDGIIVKSSQDKDPVISSLAQAILHRKPPKLLREVNILRQEKRANEGDLFFNECRHKLKGLAKEKKIPLGQFLLCKTKPFYLEARTARMTRDESKKIPSEVEEETTYIFQSAKPEPVPIVDIDHSILNKFDWYFQTYRLYLVYNEEDRSKVLEDIREEVQKWK